LHEQLAKIFAFHSPKVVHLLLGERREFLGRLEVGWEKVVCWSTKAAISPKHVIEEKLRWRAYGKSSTLFRFFVSLPHFYFRFCLYGHRYGRFCLIFASTAQQSVLEVQMDFLAAKRAYCQTDRLGASRGNLCNSTAFL